LSQLAAALGRKWSSGAPWKKYTGIEHYLWLEFVSQMIEYIVRRIPTIPGQEVVYSEAQNSAETHGPKSKSRCMRKWARG
jgi:hypothetical protein